MPKITSEMSFKEKMELRAKRFGSADKMTEKEGKSVKVELAKNAIKNQQQQKKQQGGQKREGGGNSSNNVKNNQSDNKKQKIVEQQGGKAKKKDTNTTTTTTSPILLPKDEIERRLARAAKYGTTEGVDELKAQLRMHRFGGK